MEKKNKLFSEIYSSYFQTVAAILMEAVQGPVDDQRMWQLIDEYAFAESTLNIPRAIKEDWQLLAADGSTYLQQVPTMPLSTLQKRWLKAIALDSRLALFGVKPTGLESVEPLFTPEMFYHYDRYNDGDDYTSRVYQQNFRLILQAIREQKGLVVEFLGGKNRWHRWYCVPLRLEYSAKDDKFRLNAYAFHRAVTINVGRVLKCTLRDAVEPETLAKGEEALLELHRKNKLVLQITDERNALERVLLHFSHLAKECERLDEEHYQLTLYYDAEDETEMLIRVLSFGPLVKAIAPEAFIEKIKKRLQRQRGLL